MLTKVIDSPIFAIGPDGENAHATNEYVKINSLKAIQRVYEELLKEYCK